MKKFRVFATLIVVALCTTTIFTSCNNDDDDDNGNGYFEIRATNVIGNTSGIATARAVIYDDNGNGVFTIGQAPFQNNGFTLRLTNEIPTSFLFPITEEFPANLVSDRNARVIDFAPLAYDSAGNEIGIFWLSYGRGNEGFWAWWIYADRDVTIIGTSSGDEFNLNLRRGWNTVYGYSNESTDVHRITSQRPIGANLQWHFLVDF